MVLTEEQEAALESLMARVPKSSLPGKNSQPASSDFLQTWVGFSKDDLIAVLKSLLGKKDALEGRLRDWVLGNPLDAAFEFLVLASWTFFTAEKGSNPKIETFIDAFYYIATCASVGYADIFAFTQTGRAVASLVMIVGPALTNQVLDQPAAGR